MPDTKISALPDGGAATVTDQLACNRGGSNFRVVIPTGSTTLAGITEAAIASEVNVGTDAARYVSPDALAGSNFGTAPIFFPFTNGQADPISVGDGKGTFLVPAAMNGMNIVSALGVVRTAGTTGSMDIQLRRRRAGADVDVFSTKPSFDTGESTTATGVVGVVNASNDDLATGDLLYLDVDTIHTTPAQGGGAVFEARLP